MERTRKLFKKTKSLGNVWRKVHTTAQKKAVAWSFLVAATATFGSLYFSEKLGFAPCKFCWLQRIFMYPLAVIFLTALIKKTKDVEVYTLPLAVIGALLASYHYYIQVNPNALAPCTSVGFSVSCSERFFTNFGYITIPFMALTAFVTIILLMFIKSGKLK